MKKIMLLFIIVFINTIFCFGQNHYQNGNSINVDSALVSHNKVFCGYNAANFSNPSARIANNGLLSPTALPKNTYPANAIFNCGAFRLYYEDIALNTGDGFDDAADGANRRATLCAVYQYIQSVFNFNNIPNTDPITIEIQRSFTNVNPSPNTGVLATAGPVYPNATTPGIYNGSLLNHVLTNTSPNVNLFDAVLQVNFAPIHPVTGSIIVYHTTTSLPVPNCDFDLYTVLLHEVGHQLGFASLLREDGLQRPISGFGNNQYSLYDWQNIWHGDINNPVSFEKIVTGSIANPQINPLIPNSVNYIRDGNLWLNNNGRFLGNLPIYSGVYGTWNSLTIGSVASHICGDYLSFTERFSLSPGYMKPFSMSPSVDFGETRREYTDEEIRIFLNLGYTMNPAFANSTSINGIVTNNNIISNNRAPVTTKQVTSRIAGTNAFLTFPDLVQTPDFPAINNNGTPLVINLASDATISDADGDPVRIENNTLYNIRGCGVNGNNHNCLSVNAAGNVITFTPRPNFIGRAQFGFYLHDGKERGSFMVYTIDVLPGSAFVNTPNINTPAGNNELIVNGNFEEATEVRNMTNETLFNTAIKLGREEGLFYGGVQFADAHPLQNVNWVWTSSDGLIMGHTEKDCSSGITPIRFGSTPFSFPNSAWNHPAPTTGNNYSYILGTHNYHTLASPLTTCHRYIATFDVNFANTGYAIGSVFTLNIDFNSAVVYPTNPSLQSIPVSIVVGSGWQTISVPFVYCSSIPPNFMNFTTTGFAYYDNVSLIEDLSPAPPLTVNVSAVNPQICVGNSTTLNSSVLNNYCNTTYNWQPGNFSTPSIIVNPSSTTNYVLTVNDGCRTSSASFNLIVNPLPTITLVPSVNPACIGQPMSITPSGASSYILQPGSVTSNPLIVTPNSAVNTYVVTGTDVNSCVNTAQITINAQLCNICTSCNPIGTSGSITSNAVNNVFCINNNVTIVGTKLFVGADFKMAPGVRIIVPNGAALRIINSHLYSCGDMWQGIEVQNGGQLTISNSLVEDAKIAVDVTGNTQASGNVFNLINSTFNRNDVSVFINGYNQTVSNYPFGITNCVFTCRDIPFGIQSFPTAATIGAAAINPGAPFTNSVINNSTYSQTNSFAFLKTPLAGAKPTAAIRLKAVGVTQNPQNVTPTYYEFVLGGANNTNIIDNQRIGVDLIGSNFTSYNTIYQNTATFSKGGTAGGIGINAYAPDETFNNRLKVTSTNNSSAKGNKFVDCSRAINSFNYFEHLITLNDIRSSQVFGTATANSRGKYGVKSITNRYKAYNVSSNTIYNIENGVILDATFGLLNIGSITSSSSQYAGAVNVDNNIISPQVGGSAITTNYVSNAIALSDIISSPYNIIPVSSSATSIIQTANNTITDVYRGIAYLNWEKATSKISSNTVKLVVDPTSATPQQFGIALSGAQANVNASQVNSNNITGFGITANTKVYGIADNISSGINVNCNTTTNTYHGIAFAGSCPSTKFNNNLMSNHKYGFALLNNAIIGQQGTTTSPQDNRWAGTWSGNFKTSVLSGSSSQNSKLYIRTSGTSPFNPDGSSFLYLGGTIGQDEYSITSAPQTLIPTTSNPFYIGCPVVINNGGGNPPGFVINQLEQIALDVINYQTNAQQTKTINKNQVYRLLNADPTLMDNSSILQTFYANSQSTNRKVLADVETNLITGDVIAANNLNAGVTSTDGVEINYKSFYNLAIKQAEGTITTNDSLALATLAYGCPFTDGAMVYQARVMLNVMYDNYTVYPDNCPEQNNARLGKTHQDDTSIKDENNFDAVLFPNPGANSFNMAVFGLTDGDIDVIVNDVTGKEVFKNKLNVANALTLFNLDVKNGVYFVKIKYNDKIIIKKLVVQQ